MKCYFIVVRVLVLFLLAAVLAGFANALIEYTSVTLVPIEDLLRLNLKDSKYWLSSSEFHIDTVSEE